MEGSQMAKKGKSLKKGKRLSATKTLVNWGDGSTTHKV
jgi:hypothetical protein